MRKNHVVKKRGYFYVSVSRSRFLLGESRTFRCYENASRFFRYHVSFLGWSYGAFEFVSCLEPDDCFLLSYVDREVYANV